MEYRIQVTEKLQHIETVSAASGTEAVELVRQSYKEEKIVLSSEHFSDVASPSSIRKHKPITNRPTTISSLPTATASSCCGRLTSNLT